ncbi:NAD(P)-binding domain-containing protein [Cystobacter fuscus]
MKKNEVIAYLDGFIETVRPPVREGVTVRRLAARAEGGYQVTTSAGEFSAEQVIVATGGYHTPIIPRFAERLPPSIHQLHSAQYRNPQSLPEGPVLVVGSGQSGAQIAEDLHRPAVRCIWRWGRHRAVRASTAAGTWSPGWRTWATTPSAWTNTPCTRGCATTPITT